MYETQKHPHTVLCMHQKPNARANRWFPTNIKICLTKHTKTSPSPPHTCKLKAKKKIVQLRKNAESIKRTFCKCVTFYSCLWCIKPRRTKNCIWKICNEMNSLFKIKRHEVRATFVSDVSKWKPENVGQKNDKTCRQSTQITENCWKNWIHMASWHSELVHHHHHKHLISELYPETHRICVQLF